MSIDVATLVFEFKSDSAVTAEQRMDALIAKGERLEAVAKRVRLASDGMNAAHKGAAGASEQAARGASELARQQGAVEKASLQSERALARVEAALLKRNAAFRGTEALAAMKAEAAAVGALEGRIDRLMNSLDPTRAAQSRLNAEMQEASALYKMGAISASDYAKATSVLESRMDAAARGQTMLNGVMVRGAASSKHVTQAGLGLSRQFADIGVTAAMGMNPLMILIQQGPQIVDQLALMKMQGVGLAAVLKGMGAAILPFLPALATIGTVAAVAFGGAALAARALNKDNENLVNSLGLTQKQLDHLKDKGVDTGVTIGDVFKGTFNYIRDAIAPALAPIGKWFSDLFDAITAGATAAVKAVVGGFVGAFAAIKAVWTDLPAVLGDITARTANVVIGGIEAMVNKAIGGVNKLIEAAKGAASLGVFGPAGAALASRVGSFGQVSFGRVDNQNAGAADRALEVAIAAGKAAGDRAAKGVDKFMAGWGKAITDATGDRLKKLAGDAGKDAKTPKGAAAPRDQTDERTAQIEGMIQAALADELQARLGVTREIEARADLERQIARAQEAVKAAQLDRQAANIADDKGLTSAKKAELIGQIDIVRSINARSAAYREQAITENKVVAQSREAFGIRQAGAEVQLRELASQEAVAKFEHRRYGLARDRLTIEQSLEREALEQVTAANGATEAQVKIAQSLLNRLGAIQANEREAFRMGALDRAVGETTLAIQDIRDAVRDHNWGRLFTSLVNVVDQAIVAFANAKTGAERMSASGSLISAVGGAVGGKAGSAIGAVGAGFSAAGSAVGMAGSFGAIGGAIAGLAGPIGIAVAGFSLLSGILGDQKAKKRAKQEQEARDMENARQVAQERANQQAEMELRILELSGDEVGALARRREAELAALDGANRALAEHIHKLEDWAKAVDLAKTAVSKAEDDLRDAYEAEKDRLNGIVAGVDTARDRLRDAYGRERSAIESTISSVSTLVNSFTDFRKELDMMAVANDPTRQYGYAQRQFAGASNDNLIERGRAFAEASQSASATDLDFQRDLAAVRRRTDEAAKTAQTQLSAAEQQLLALDNLMSPLLGANDNLISIDEAIRGLQTAEQQAALAVEELARLDAQVGALITINTSVMSVAQAVNNLQGALGALAAAQASKPTGGAAGAASQVVGLAGYVDKNADLAALYASGTGMAAGRTKEEFAAYHWERYGQAEGRAFTAFARGGDHMGGLRLVGEEGPELESTGPSRIYSAKQTAQMLGGDNSRLEALVEALTDEVAQLRKERTEDARQIKRDAKDTADILAKVTQGGDTVRVKAA